MTTYAFSNVQEGSESGSTWGATVNFGATYWTATLVEPPDGDRRWSAATMTLAFTSGTGGSGTAIVYLNSRLRPAQWSDSNLPSLAQLDIVGTATGTIDAVTDLAVPLTLNNSNGSSTRLLSELTRGDSDHSLGFVVLWSGGDFVGTASLSGTYTTDTLTGLEGPWRAQGRVDRCPRCGHPSTRDTWVRDGYNPGLRVCPKCYDPPDQVGRHARVGSEKPPVGE